MLVLRRKAGEKVVISGGITVEVISIKGSTVQLGIEAPDGTAVDRLEVAEAKRLYPRTLD